MEWCQAPVVERVRFSRGRVSVLWQPAHEAPIEHAITFQPTPARSIVNPARFMFRVRNVTQIWSLRSTVLRRLRGFCSGISLLWAAAYVGGMHLQCAMLDQAATTQRFRKTPSFSTVACRYCAICTGTNWSDAPLSSITNALRSLRGTRVG